MGANLCRQKPKNKDMGMTAFDQPDVIADVGDVARPNIAVSFEDAVTVAADMGEKSATLNSTTKTLTNKKSADQTNNVRQNSFRGPPPIQATIVPTKQFFSDTNLSDELQDKLRGVTTHQDCSVVVAIDLGVTYSGYAYSFISSGDSVDVHLMRQWSGDAGIANHKMPSALLLTDKLEFHSFGHIARDTYYDLEAKHIRNWHYFENLKLAITKALYRGLRDNTEIESVSGKGVNAITVLTHCLRYLKERALDEVADQAETQLSVSDVRWVIALPATWTFPAKQLIRLAARQAEMCESVFSDQVLIIHEPEAASIYCRTLRRDELMPRPKEARLLLVPPSICNSTCQLVTSTNTPCTTPPRTPTPTAFRNSNTIDITACLPAIQDLSTGSRYVIVDCGGMSVDITVHQIDADNTITEIHRVSDETLGSSKVNDQFEQLLSDIFGSDFFAQFKKESRSAYLALMIAFEGRKRAFGAIHRQSSYQNDTGDQTLQPPSSIFLPLFFITFFQQYKKMTVEDAIRRYGNKGVRWSVQGVLRIDHQAMRQLFAPTVTQIVQQTRKVLSTVRKVNGNLNQVRYLFLVGGFAESEIVQQEIRKEFERELKLIIPQGVSLAVLHGAVMYGRSPLAVNMRRAQQTYGVRSISRYVDGKHPHNKMVVDSHGTRWCVDILDKFITSGQSVAAGEELVVRSYSPVSQNQSYVMLYFYTSPRSEAEFIDDDNVYLCGRIRIDLGKQMADGNSTLKHDKKNKTVAQNWVGREIQVALLFSDCDLHVVVKDVSTGNCKVADIDSLFYDPEKTEAG